MTWENLICYNLGSIVCHEYYRSVLHCALHSYLSDVWSGFNSPVSIMY